MEAAPAQPRPSVPPPTQPDVLAAWPRSAQWFLAIFLGLATALVGLHGYDSSRWASRPTTLERRDTLAYRIDLNEAEHAELLQLPGVGENLAERIEEYRRVHGVFQRVSDLVKVRGIGPAMSKRLHSWVGMDDEAPEAAPAMSARLRIAAKAALPGSSRTGSKKAAGLSAPIDINRATAAELQRLPGVGPKTAQTILAERRKAPFQSVEELRRVHGIGPRKLEALRAYVIVGGQTVRVATRD